DHAGANDEGLDLGEGEHEWRQLETGPEQVADAGLAIDRNARRLQVSDVPINGPHRYFELVGKHLRGDQAIAAQMLDDFEEAVGSAHDFFFTSQKTAWRPTRLPSLSRMWKNDPMPSGRSIRGVSSAPPAFSTRPTISSRWPSQLR